MSNTLKLILIGLLIIFGFSKCYTSKRAEGQVNKANDKFPEIVAKLARDKYPCTELLKTDTALVFQDTLIYVDCPDTAVITNSNDYTMHFNTTPTISNGVPVKVITKTIRVPVNVQLPQKIITKYFEDSAKLKLAAIDAANYQKTIDKLQSDLKDMTGKRNWFRKYFYIELSLLIILLILAIWRIWKQATTIKVKS